MSRMLTFAVAALAAIVAGFAPSARADDLKAMEGKWRMQSVEADGKAVDPGELKDQELTITDGRYSVMTKDGPDAGTLKLDEAQNPRTMDATRTEGFEAGKVVKAIYKLEGDTLLLCVAPERGERPTELVAKEGSGWVLITYQRQR